MHNDCCRILITLMCPAQDEYEDSLSDSGAAGVLPVSACIA